MVQKLARDTDVSAVLRSIGTDSVGQAIMAKKGAFNLFLLQGLDLRAANILKQDALSVGADLALHRECASLRIEKSDALLMCTDAQCEKLVRKEHLQPFGLKQISAELEAFLVSKERTIEPCIMGVLNINEDSFFEKSRTKEEEFVTRFLRFCDEGARIIDIGGVSSRPGSVYVGQEEELRRLKPIFSLIRTHGLHKKAQISIDTFDPVVARAALDAGCHIINDITGLCDDALAAVIGEYDATVVIMHMRGMSDTMQTMCEYDNLFGELDAYFSERLERAAHFGISNCILDVGIGFAKNISHNLALIKHLEHFKKFRLPLLVGASRKSMINDIVETPVSQRLAGTLCTHQKALDAGADIIRAHDVAEHVQMLRIWEAFRRTNV